MGLPDNTATRTKPVKTFFIKYLKFRSSIYSRVVYIITISSIILFLVFWFHLQIGL